MRVLKLYILCEGVPPVHYPMPEVIPSLSCSHAFLHELQAVSPGYRIVVQQVAFYQLHRFHGEMDDTEELDWKSLPAPDKEVVKKEIKKWFLVNYKPSSKACLSRDAVYEHFISFCQRKNLPTGSKTTLTLIIAKLYSHVYLRRKGQRNKNKYYYCGIDIDPKSSDYKRVAQARLINDEPIKIPKAVKAGSGDSNGAGTSSSVTKEKEQPNLGNIWSSLLPAEKKKSRATTEQWLKKDFEVSPAMCLLRHNVYSCYVEFCKGKNITPAPQAVFGKMLLKKFPGMIARRLGVRGDSKYYYMGIDVCEDSKFHAKFDAEKIVDRPTLSVDVTQPS
ncbi:hypothetical protein LSAT2_011518 [Lamellibrachia satsuma]|nr:hypothetical protein LSAT2_011518 [Lamellibrachia satsuma]